jgi:CheY-like chemotaxis protein
MKAPTDTLLIVEDEPDDVEFLQRAFLKAGATNPVQVVGNGEQAIAYLKGDGRYADRAQHPFPRVIITDLKMPQMDGLQLLEWVHLNPRFRVVPTIVLTSSTAQADVNAAYRYGAAAYIVKPVEFRELQRIAQVLVEYWRLARMPDPET